MDDKDKASILAHRERAKSIHSVLIPELPDSKEMLVPVVQKDSDNTGMLSAPKNIQKHISLKTRYLEVLLRRSHRSEVQAAHVMRELTTKFGTRGKSAKTVFLQAFVDDMRKSNEQGCGCVSEAEKEKMKKKLQAAEDGEGPPAFLGKERPAAIVAQSSFVRHLLDVVQNEIHRVGCPAPTFERDRAIEQAKKDYVKMNDDFKKVGRFNLQEIARDQTKEDIIIESEDKLIGRLKIYSRAFSSVILHFQALRPILLDIKRNYDTVLKMKNQQMVQLRIVKKSIAYKEKSIDDYMEELRFECYSEMAEMEKQSYKLMRHIDKQDAAIKTMTDILNRLEITLGEEHELRRDADDQKRMLTQEVNEYRKKLGMPLRTDDGAQIGFISEEVVINDDAEEEEALSTEDPLILRVALLTCRKNLNEIQIRLVVLEAEYEDVIPRRQLENLKVDMAELEIKHEGLIETYNALNSQVQLLKDQIDKLNTEREDNQTTIEGLRVKATPRPSWPRMGEHLTGGSLHWSKVTEGKDSVFIKDKMIEELTSRKISGPPDYLTALGTSTKIKFLRYDNRVRERNLPRRDAAMIIHDIWQVREQEMDLIPKYRKLSEDDTGGFHADSSETHSIRPFSDFLVTYFTDRYPILSIRMEWTYNLVDACKRFTLDRRLTQFLRITEESFDECVYHQFRNEVSRLQSLLLRKSDEEKQPPGSLPRPVFAKVLREAFPNKTEEGIASLLKAASKQSKAHSDWSTINYNDFFTISDEGIVGIFADELATQYDDDRYRYCREILVALAAALGVPIQSAEREDDPSGDAAVNMQQFYKAISSVDPHISEEKIAAAIAWVFTGVTTLPGQERKCILLLNYVKSRVHSNSDAEQVSSNTDDEEFERAIKAVTGRDDDEEDHISMQQKHQMIKKLKVTNLKTVLKRLKGAAFLRSGEKDIEVLYDSRDQHAEEADDGEIQLSPSEELIPVDAPLDTN